MTTRPVFQVTETTLPEIHERKPSQQADDVPQKMHKVSVSSGYSNGEEDSTSPGGSRRSSVTQGQGAGRPRRPSIRLTTNATPRGSSIQGTPGLSLLTTGRRQSIRHGKGKGRGNSPEEEKIDLPQHPRFLALLSPEAQYSAMKCYEDIIYAEITELFPEYRNVVQRCPSPDISRLAIKSAGEEEDHVNKHTESHALVTAPTKQIIPYGRSHTDMTHNRLPQISKEKRLLMTYRFQSAMDILDNIRLQTGHIITSCRPAAKSMDPIHYFNVWNSHWSKEFEMN
jgi:hypothetical protein